MTEISTAKPADPRDAATVMLLRGPANQPEIFMVKRTSKAKFMANAMVFPGGRLDDADCTDKLASHCALSRVQAASRLGIDDGQRALGLHIAALRETFEEAGVLLARCADEEQTLTHSPMKERLVIWRDRLNAGEASLLEMVEEEHLILAVDELRYFSHWVTPEVEKRRYDTRFFLATAPEEQVPSHDTKETTASAWLNAETALDRYEASDIQLAPPTLRVLMDIAADPAIVHPATICPVPAPICPKPHFEDDRLHLILPGDPDFEPPGSTPNRVILEQGRWVSVGTGSRLITS